MTYLLIILAAIANAFMDLSSEGLLHSDWWNKETSWMNKWKLGDPELGPKFWGSTTVFVFLTDGWHLFQFIFHTSWQMALAIQTEQWFVAFVFIKVIFSVIFEITYSKIKNR